MSGAAAIEAFSANQTLIAGAVCLTGACYALTFRQYRPALGLALLLWLTLGLGGDVLVERLGESPRVALAGVAVGWLPWNLLLCALLPRFRALNWPAAVWLGLLAAEYAAALGFGLDPLALNAALAARAPALLSPWLSPLEPLLAALAAVALFGRWVRTAEAGDLVLGLTATLMLLVLLRPHWAFGAVLGSAAMLLGAVFHATHRMAFIDPLTGLANRRALEAALANLGRDYALAMLDVDHFKRINDRYGHDFGDQVLRMVAARIKRHRRCRPFRYGGEEFCLLFKTAKAPLVKRWCEEIRVAVGGRPIVPRGPQRPPRRPLNKRRYRRESTQLNVTVSIGLALSGGRFEDAEAVIEAADKALYRAKRNGRDRVSVARG